MSLNGDRLREHDDRFVEVAAATLDSLLESNPERATELGDHRFDGRLSDWSPPALEERSRQLSAQLWDLDRSTSTCSRWPIASTSSSCVRNC